MHYVLPTAVSNFVPMTYVVVATAAAVPSECVQHSRKASSDGLPEPNFEWKDESSTNLAASSAPSLQILHRTVTRIAGH